MTILLILITFCLNVVETMFGEKSGGSRPRGPGGRPLLFRPEGPKKIFVETAPLLSNGLDDSSTLSQGLDPAL